MAGTSPTARRWERHSLTPLGPAFLACGMTTASKPAALPLGPHSMCSNVKEKSSWRWVFFPRSEEDLPQPSHRSVLYQGMASWGVVFAPLGGTQAFARPFMLVIAYARRTVVALTANPLRPNSWAMDAGLIPSRFQLFNWTANRAN